AWTRSPHELAERLLALGRVRVRDSDPKRSPVDAAVLEGTDELHERLAAPADALDRDDLPVGDRQDRLDAQHLPGPCARATDPAAPRQVLEGVDGEDNAQVASEPPDHGVHLVGGRPAAEPPLAGEREHGEAGR